MICIASFPQFSHSMQSCYISTSNPISAPLHQILSMVLSCTCTLLLTIPIFPLPSHNTYICSTINIILCIYHSLPKEHTSWHGWSTLQVYQRGGWALFRLFLHLTTKERPHQLALPRMGVCVSTCTCIPL